MFDPVQLRTFLAVADTLSFTRAAERLQLSQPTVSQHIRKLEASAGRVLIARDTREVRMTDNGDAMAGFARSILASHEAAAAYFSGSAMRGRLRFGMADDLAITDLPRILRNFRQLYPQVNLELTVAQSKKLHRKLRAGHLDLVFVKWRAGGEEGTTVRRDSFVWVGQERTSIEPSEPVPLIVYPAPALSRQFAIDALEKAGRTWRITCTTQEVNGVLAAVRAGIGIAVLPQSLIPGDLMQVHSSFNLPAIGDVDFTLLSNPVANQELVSALSSAILDRNLHRSL